jgi:hypothetical protein
MKSTSRLFSSTVTLMALLMLLMPALAVSAGPQLQAGESAWVVWETCAPGEG